MRVTASSMSETARAAGRSPAPAAASISASFAAAAAAARRRDAVVLADEVRRGGGGGVSSYESDLPPLAGVVHEGRGRGSGWGAARALRRGSSSSRGAAGSLVALTRSATERITRLP